MSVRLPVWFFGLLLLVVSHAASAVEALKNGEGKDPPAEGFASLAELFRWASTSSFGGGGISTYHLGERDVHVVNRSFTSGRASTELSFYVRQTASQHLARALYLPVRQVETRSRQDGDTLVVEQYDFRKGTWVAVLTVTARCFDP